MHVHIYAHVKTPTGLPKGSSQAEDLGTEQLSAYAQTREMMLYQEELLNLSQVYKKRKKEKLEMKLELFYCPYLHALVFYKVHSITRAASLTRLFRKRYKSTT